jgi:cyclophilin family peptidyl-prolyl cis-trans isomerase
MQMLRGSKGHGWYGKYLAEGQDGFRRSVPPTPFDWEAGDVKRPRAFFNVMMEDNELGKIEIELAEDVVPNTVKNFKALCEGQGRYKYLDTPLHKVMKGIAIMGGDVENLDGTGNHSAGPNRHIADENFIIPHSGPGLVSMASVGLDTSGSQFYISMGNTAHMNGYCVVFGRIVGGEKVLKDIEKVSLS